MAKRRIATNRIDRITFDIAANVRNLPHRVHRCRRMFSINVVLMRCLYWLAYSFILASIGLLYLV